MIDNYLNTNMFIIIVAVCLFCLLMCLIDRIIERRYTREKCYVKQQLNDYANKLLLISLDIICDNYRQMKKYTQEEIDDYVDKMYEIKGLMKMLE